MLPGMRVVLAAALLALALPAVAYGWGGSYPTGDTYGSSVQIKLSDTYPVDETVPQSWATFLGTLVHGPELAKLTLRLQPIDEVQQICGASALACYDPSSETIVASPDEQLDAPPAHEIVMHEYGHHIANNETGAPYRAEDYGTKRWASYENICARVTAGALFPGDEGFDYTENPGEAFAESYRVLNLTLAGATGIAWTIVDRDLYPDATALQLLQEDIADPWTHPEARLLHGTFGYGVVRTFRVGTPLDGTFTARLRAPTGTHMQLVVSDGQTVLGRGNTVHVNVCGQRRLTLQVARPSGRGGRFAIDVTKP
jgi:hypothetical protein